jgi:MoaA/NifB/PqqE/SkfB family radical SAM enzyme
MIPFKLHPILCNYYITTRCNAQCLFCQIHQQKGMDSDTSDVLNNLTGLRKLGIRFIDFTGGEPLLHPHLAEILRTAKRLGFITTVTTNCILYPRYASELTGLIDFLHFSLDAPNQKLHDTIRGVLCFERVMESLDLAKKLGEKPDILFTVNESNAGHLHEMIQLAKKLHRILLVNPVFSYFNNPGPEKITLEAIGAVASQPYVYVNRGILRLIKHGGNMQEIPRCRAVTTTVVVSPQNQIVLPCFHKAVRCFPIHGNIQKVYSSSDVQRYKRLEGRFSFCRGCTISCYFDPSFTKTLDDYFLLSQISKCKYAWDKYVRV